MKVADFFCGGGGFSEGFRQAGFEIVFAVDSWAPAVKTYKGNKPGVNVIQDDVIRISELPDDEFEALVPDSEVIIGSPPCQSFSHSNKSGNADKSLGIRLIEAYLKIIARKKYKQGSILRYWVLENVPAVKNYIKEEYSAADFNLKGDFILRPLDGASGKYNAKYFGAPTNRIRYLCGEFPKPMEVKNDSNVITLQMVLDSLGDPLRMDNDPIVDINYPDLALPCQEITDQHYIYELAEFECKTAKRLKQDKGYMGKMSFPENTSKPARTVMATMSASSREAMILGYRDGKYRLPTVREAAYMMSFPLDFWFYGDSKGIKHTLVGNAVPPKLSYAIAKAIAEEEHEPMPKQYPRIEHDNNIEFINLNGVKFEIKKETPRREVSKFKYHIPYLIIDAYRVELTNYHSDFKNKIFRWDAEIHYSQGKDKAKIYLPTLELGNLPETYHLFKETMMDASMFYYDSVQCCYAFKNELFPLSLSGVRNVLISQGFLIPLRDTQMTRFYISPTYETLIAKHCKARRKQLSLEQLKKQLEKNELAGEKAEVFVFEHEKKRLGQPLGEKVRRISEIDVTAGYDIVSFNSNQSLEPDRFIEVKAVSNAGFYWSRNEYEIAKLKGNTYYLYLVDLNRIDEQDYSPQMIQNPAVNVMDTDEWFVESQSYYVKHI